MCATGKGSCILDPVGGDERVDARIPKSQGAFWGLGTVLLPCKPSSKTSQDIRRSSKTKRLLQIASANEEAPKSMKPLFAQYRSMPVDAIAYFIRVHSFRDGVHDKMRNGWFST